MGLTETIGRLLGATPRAVEAVPLPPTGDTIDPDDDLYRRLTGSRRDLTPVAAAKARKVSLYLWRSNPMAHRLIETMTDFVVGDGLTISAPDERVADLANAWWTDPAQRLDLRHRDIVRDLALMGELAVRAFVNPTSGRMRIGFVDPERIDDVTPDPENALLDAAILVRSETGAEAVPVPIVRYDDTSRPGSPAWAGDAFYFAVNRVLGQHRGTPDLLSIADWIDGYDQLLFNALERSGLVNAFVWDVTLKGADGAGVRKWLSENATAPPPGSVRAHNESEVWTANAPTLGNTDTVALGRAIKNMGLGGFGWPEAWFAEGDSTNRATLTAQGDPTYAMLAARQRYVSSMFAAMLDFVVERAVVAGQLPADVDRTITVSTPSLSAADTSAIATALPQVVNAVTAAIDAELIDRRNGRRMFLIVANQLGADIDEAEVVAAIEEEQAEDDAKAGDAAQAQLDALMAMPPALPAEPVPAPVALPPADPMMPPVP
jgi:hypothetical protein